MDNIMHWILIGSGTLLAVMALVELVKRLAYSRELRLAKHFTEDILAGEFPSALGSHCASAVSCVNCSGSRVRPRWRIVDANKVLNHKNLVKLIYKSKLCEDCLKELAATRKATAKPAKEKKANNKEKPGFLARAGNFLLAIFLLSFAEPIAFYMFYIGKQAEDIVVRIGAWGLALILFIVITTFIFSSFKKALF